MKRWFAALLATGLAIPLLWAQDAVPDASAATPAETQPEAVPVPEPPPPVLPLRVHCGQLVKVEPATSVTAVDVTKAIEEGKFAPDPGALPSTVQRDAPSGEVFAVAEFRLSPDQSVGKTDFVLRFGSDEQSDCLAMAEGTDAFDERLFELKKSTVRLLFSVREGTTSVSLAYAPTLQVPLPPSRSIPFGEQPVVEEPMPVEPVAAPAPPSPAPEPEPVAKPEAKPEPKPEPKPAPKPEPKPEPKKPADTGIPLF